MTQISNVILINQSQNWYWGISCAGDLYRHTCTDIRQAIPFVKMNHSIVAYSQTRNWPRVSLIYINLSALRQAVRRGKLALPVRQYDSPPQSLELEGNLCNGQHVGELFVKLGCTMWHNMSYIHMLEESSHMSCSSSSVDRFSGLWCCLKRIQVRCSDHKNHVINWSETADVQHCALST